MSILSVANGWRNPRGKRPDRVQMVVQHDHGFGRERMIPACLAKRGTQFIDVFGQQLQPPIRQIDGEEEATPGNEITTIIGHVDMPA
jgi:hypothetical protein